jgi:ABC-type dipeptide/oligopeptide/nickel transport system permease subunit
MAVAEATYAPGWDEMTPTRRFTFLREIFRRKIATVAVIFLVIFYSVGILAPFLAPYDVNDQDLSQAREAPSWEHPLGTDPLGRDMLTRVMYASRTTIIFTVCVIVTGGLFLGVGLGLVAGYRGGWIDTAIMRIGEVLGGLPTLIIILSLTAAFRTRINDLSFWLKDNTFLGDDARTVVQFLIITGATVPFAWIGTSRIVRGQALALREMDYVAAAEAMGAGTGRIVTRHILPGVMPLVMVGLSGAMGAIAGTELALSFLGLGINPPTASFGTMIADGAGPRTFEDFPHLLLSAAIPVVLFIFAWNLLGDALVDIMQPQTRRR